jgi:DNA-binding transcriptional MerR regulator
MDERDQDKIIHRAVRRIADELGCTVAEVNALLDSHPIEVDRDKYLKRVLALQLLQLDELEEAFHDKAIVDRDVPSGVLLIKAQERRATLLGLNPPLGRAVRCAARARAPADQH